MGRLAVSLGGRAAEDVVFGQPTTGAESDLKAATSLARRMVGLWGMTDEVGPVSYGVGETQPFLGRELAAPREYAEATAARIDEAVTRDHHDRPRPGDRDHPPSPARARRAGRRARRARDGRQPATRRDPDPGGLHAGAGQGKWGARACGRRPPDPGAGSRRGERFESDLGRRWGRRIRASGTRWAAPTGLVRGRDGQLAGRRT